MKLAASDPKDFQPGDGLFDKTLGTSAEFVRYDEAHPEFVAFVKYRARSRLTGIIPFRLANFSLTHRRPAVLNIPDSPVYEPEVTESTGTSELVSELMVVMRGDMDATTPKQTRRGRRIQFQGHGFTVGDIVLELGDGTWCKSLADQWSLWEVVEVMNADFFVVRRHGRRGARTPAARKTGTTRPKPAHQPKGRKFDFGT